MFQADHCCFLVAVGLGQRRVQKNWERAQDIQQSQRAAGRPGVQRHAAGALPNAGKLTWWHDARCV